MSNDPSVFVRNFEQKFEAHKDKPRLQFLVNFRPRELHFYMLIVTELRGPRRRDFDYAQLFRTFPLDHWEPTIMELLKKFVKKPAKSPRITGVENGLSFIEAICREFPEFFADMLDDLFIARISFPGLYNRYMWQRFGKVYGQFLQMYVETNSDDTEEQCRGLSYALIVGDRELERWAKNFIRNDLDIPRKFVEGLNLQAEMLNSYLHEMGMEWRGNDIIPLYVDEVLHLTFAYRYLHLDMDQDSFYKINPLPKSTVFGGAMTATNQNGRKSQVQHILSLDPIPSFLPVSGLYRLYIAWDMDQVLFTTGATFQKHHSNGAVTILDDNRQEYPEGKDHFSQSTPFIKSTKIVLSDQGKAFQYQRPGRKENYYRLGGAPTFLNQANYPRCCECKRTMVFILQLDSHLPRADEKPQEWGEDGMAFVFWCDRCKISGVDFQSE